MLLYLHSFQYITIIDAQTLASLPSILPGAKTTKVIVTFLNLWSLDHVILLFVVFRLILEIQFLTYTG